MSDTAPAVAPEDVLRTVTKEPWNAEAPLASLRSARTPTHAFYVRNNFIPPMLDAGGWRLRIGGAVLREVGLDLRALQAMTSVTRRVTLECAGNGRLLLAPPTPGTQWGLGAAGCADFTGVALADVLRLAGVARGAVECVFTGADSGIVPQRGHVPFQRSLPIDLATSHLPFIAWEMNGEPLTRDHGFPVRLVVPGWYAVASVKWLTSIDVVEEPFDGHFQTDRYVYRTPGAPIQPVTWMRVRSLITRPADEAVAESPVRIEGIAWSGVAGIARVDVSVDGGPWRSARLDGESRPAETVGWSADVELPPGTHTLRARATDEAGAVQPESPQWNELGYGNNAIQTIRVEVAG